jgi:hypothetical protein
MAQNEAQAGIRTAMGAEMTDIQKQQIAEQSRLRDLNAQLDLGQAEGAQMAAQNAEEAAAAQTQQGIQGAMSLGMQGLNAAVPLFPSTGASKAATTTPTTSPAPTNPLPGTAQSYGPAGINWNPQGVTGFNTFGPQMPQPGTQYGMLGTNFSGVGY